ncbi:MAG: VOC family protein [Betaproteobacteria bacterium]|nr:VOC family protein [Betaproteobacteria bacterium]
MSIIGLDHFQVAIPHGHLDAALAFYVDLLGFTRIAKPAELSPEGAWLTQGGINLHLGEEAHFAPSRRAHPALLVDNLLSLMDAAQAKGLETRMDSGPQGFLRGSVFDPFGNRIELMQAL